MSDDHSIVEFPTTAREFMSMRVVKTSRSINDQVEDILTAIWDDGEFRQWVKETNNKDSITGHFLLDRGKAVHFIREQAQEMGFTQISTLRDYDIVKAIEVAMRRRKMGRNQRRHKPNGGR